MEYNKLGKMATTKLPMRPINLLSFDGGGTRGLSSLIILKRIMHGLERQMGLNENSLLPCDFFDLIGGTSTGGLAAIMLGPLRMDLDSCIERYRELGQQLFPRESCFTRRLRKRKTSLIGTAKFDGKKLESWVKNVIGASQNAEGPESRLDFEFRRHNDIPKCRVFVCATEKTTKEKVLFRTYSLGEQEPKCAMWQACRATSATPFLFDHIEFGEPTPIAYMAGGFGMNNPIYALIDEASRIWAKDTDQLKIGSVISIGTGLAPTSRIQDANPYVVKTLSDIATDAKRTAEAFAFELDHNGPKFPNMTYFRFSVGEGFDQNNLAEWKQHRKITRATGIYLNQNVKMLESCVKSILGHLTKDTKNESESSFEHERDSSITLATSKNSLGCLVSDLPLASINHQPGGCVEGSDYETIELAREKHELGIRDSEAIELFRAASEFYRRSGTTLEQEVWISRAWKVCSDLNDHRAKWAHTELAYRLACYCFDNSPTSASFSSVPQRALIWAVDANHLTLLELLISKKKFYPTIDEDGNNLLHRCLRKDQPCAKAVQILIENNVDPNQLNGRGYLPLKLLKHKFSSSFILIHMLFLPYGVSMWPERRVWVKALKELIGDWPHQQSEMSRRWELSIFHLSACARKLRPPNNIIVPQDMDDIFQTWVLILAIRTKNYEIIKSLLEAGAEIPSAVLVLWFDGTSEAQPFFCHIIKKDEQMKKLLRSHKISVSKLVRVLEGPPAREESSDPIDLTLPSTQERSFLDLSLSSDES